MNAVESLPSSYDAAPSVALACIALHDGPVLLDFDETLYLRNSTEDFIDLARPGLLAILLLRLLDIVRPWRWTGGEETRDVWRVRLILTLFPWVQRRWTQQAGWLATRYGNTQLLEALQRHAVKPIIVTAGFHPIVAPLVAALGLPEARIVAASLRGCNDRIRGKLRCVLDELGEETLRRALLITDSSQDMALLRVCKRSLRTVWPGALYRRALTDVYLPGQYLTHIKRPGEHYIRRGILQEDFAFWVFTSILVSPDPAFHVGALLMLLASFWVIYEQGYVDNDLIALRYESEPKVHEAYSLTSVAAPRVEPWIWALVLGALGVALLRRPGAAALLEFAKWILLLVGCHFWFKLYNRLDKDTRVWLFGGLQLARAAAFIILVPVPSIGALALGANALARWTPYYVYRLTGNSWPQRNDVPITRLMYFVALAALLGLAQGAAAVWNCTTLLLLTWSTYRAHDSLKDVLSRAWRLDRAGKRL